MIVSTNWLKEYVDLGMSHDDLVDRLTMSGLNHEGTEAVNGDEAIDLEVTSNRPDCLGHIGVAREIAALYDQMLTIPNPQPATIADSVKDHCQVVIESDSCFRYTARLIRGAKIGPSPDWLKQRLETLGVASVNNVVDATNYVMFECGQPLHAFDFAKIKDGKVIIRDAQNKETFLAIDHKEYALDPKMCVVADPENAVALAGVMGGADSEISAATTDILIEVAYFDQLSVRNAARKTKLQSASSFRFERNIDSVNLDWASRRVCEIILDTAGGELLADCIDVGQAPATPEPVTLRLAQLERVLGIVIPSDLVPGILEKLGLKIQEVTPTEITAFPPSWRKDLTREVDLIEEVGRIYGFDKIPDDVNVPMAASYRPEADRVIDLIRSVMTNAGFDESITASLVPPAWSDSFNPWTEAPPLQASQPMLGVLDDKLKNVGQVNLLRRTLVPSLLEIRRINEYRSNTDAKLFETAKVYLSQGADQVPDQPLKLAFVSDEDYYSAKGVVETLVHRLASQPKLEIKPCQFDLLDGNLSGEFWLNGELLGWLGKVSASGMKHFGLRTDAVVGELDIAVLEKATVKVRTYSQHSLYPAITRDFNFILDEGVRWAELEACVCEAASEIMESVKYKETFRNEAKDGPDKKRLMLTVVLRSKDSTLTGQQADEVCNKIVSDCETKLKAALVS